MLQFKPSKMTLALLSSGVMALSLPMFAQAADAEKVKKEKADKEIEIIQVTGFRKSVIESINTKRYSSNVVEAISAEDIGKLPDSSIAESIARLPGLAAQRLDGRASKVSIRGFGENESGTTFNGREQVSIGDNRGVEFDLYPSEIMSGVTVYKTPDASLEGEGIAGTIDMQTIKPLEQDGQVIQFNGQFEKTSFGKLNPDGDDKGFRGTFSYLDQFADNTIGVAFAYSTMKSPNQEKRWNSWGYPSFSVDGQDYSILGGAKPYVRSSTLNRDSAMLVVEAAPDDNLKMTFDALYVDFTDEKTLRGIEIPFAWGQGSLSSQQIDAASGFITQGTTEGQRVVVRNDHENRDAQLTSLGFNTKWVANELWSVEVDASYSKVNRKIWSLESYSGTGRGNDNGVADTLGYTFNSGNTGATFTHGLDYSDYNLIQLGGPLTWGWSGALNNKFGITGTPLENSAQDGFINAPTVDDELKALKIAASQEIDSDFITDITYGLSYKERDKTKVSEGYFMTLNAFPNMLTVPEQYRKGSVSLDFIGMGNMIAYDSVGLINDGYYDLTQESLTNISHATKSWSVNEKVTAAFVKADISSEIEGLPLTGNVGVRYVRTEQSSQGNAAANVNGMVVATPTDVSDSYSNVLPSLNLSLKIDDTQTLRFGAAKTISRARMDEMNASIERSYNVDQVDENGNHWSVSGGNTLLRPKEATGVDLSYENYFSDEGYFSTAFFWKDITTWTFDESYQVDLTGVPNPSDGIVPEFSGGTRNSKVNGGGGSLWGYELSVTVPFNLFDESLEGLGVIASYTGVKSNMKDQNDNPFQLPGLSDNIQTFTLYYEKNGFQARASMRKRGDFKGDVYGLGFSTNQVDIIGETIWDAQIGYDFGEAGIESLKGLSIFLQAQNITEEPFTSLQGDNALQVRDYQDYGSTYLLGFSYKL
jgi:iron complex outermembrane receptor protein